MNKSTFQKFIEKSSNLVIVDFLLALPLLILPLLVSLPYRVNIFLTWEGAYRMQLGQVPFEDFGMPMGFGFWLLPTLFFKVFGPTFLSLIKAQVFINLVSLLALRGILYNLKVKPLAITFTLLVFSLTYIIYNFWPWYNHSVVVFELVSLYFITSFFNRNRKWSYYLHLSLAGIFTFLTFFTKQDVGGICFLLCLFMVSYISLTDKTWKPVMVYVISFGITACFLILPFVQDDFFYWFNYGQPPHNSRVSIGLLLDTLLSQSLLEKIYLIILLIGILLHVSSFTQFFSNRNLFLTTVICAGMILQSVVTRVTSPLPTDHMNYYHTFGFVGIVLFLPWEKWSSNYRYLSAICLCLVITFSSGFWKYVSGIFKFKSDEIVSVKKDTQPWVKSAYPTLKHVTLPVETNEGIKKIMELPFAHNKDLKVLNMSELTFLAYEMGYTPQVKQPLWYHLNIGIFQKEVNEINERVRDGYYDLILFEDIPSLNNFYPYTTLDEVKKKYFSYDKFLAPRKLEDSSVEVFVHQDLATRYHLKSKE